MINHFGDEVLKVCDLPSVEPKMPFALSPAELDRVFSETSRVLREKP